MIHIATLIVLCVLTRAITGAPWILTPVIVVGGLMTVGWIVWGGT